MLTSALPPLVERYEYFEVFATLDDMLKFSDVLAVDERVLEGGGRLVGGGRE